MDKELFFDIVSDEWAGGLYRVTSESGTTNFYYHHSLSDLEDDNQKTVVTESFFPGFAAFWKQFTLNNKWFTFHPLFIHPDGRAFIREELKKVNWKQVADDKWREMYQRQWNKVLNNPATYYKPLQP